jgi:hypothetical protein
MLKVAGRIKQLEAALGLRDRTPSYVHRIVFVATNGDLTGTLVLSDDPAMCRPFEPTQEMVADDAQTSNAAGRKPSGAM